MTKSKIKSVICDYLVMTFASAVFAFAWEGFMIPNGMSAGGLMGLATVVQYATNGIFQAQYTYVAINAALILLSVFAFGIGFGFRTLFSILMTTVLLQLFSGFDFLHAAPGHFFYVKEAVLVPIIAGALEAVGVGLILRCGGSTGGTDIIALMVNKYWPVSLSKMFFVTDLIIICTLLFLPDKTFSDCVYGFEMMVVFSLVIDTVVGGQKSTFQILVFSEKYEQIANHIIKRMDRGVTLLKAQGWYTKKDRAVLLILLTRNQLPEVSRVIKEYDPRAFMSVTAASSVYGEGFEEIKAGLHRKKITDNGTGQI